MAYKGRGRQSTYLSIRFVGWTATLFMICGLFLIWKGDQSWLQNAPMLQFWNTTEKNLNISVEMGEDHHGKYVNLSIAVEESQHGKNMNVSMVVEESHQENNVNMAVEEGYGKNLDVSMAGEESRQEKNVHVSMAMEEGHGNNVTVSMVVDENHQEKNVNVSMAVEEDHGRNGDVSLLGEENNQEKNVNVFITVEERHRMNVDVSMAGEENHPEKYVNVSMVEEESHQKKNMNVSITEEEGHGKNVDVSMVGEENLEEKYVNVSMVGGESHQKKKKNVDVSVTEEGGHGKNVDVSMEGKESHQEKNGNVFMVGEESHPDKNVNDSIAEEKSHEKNVNLSMDGEESHQEKHVNVSMLVETGQQGKHENVSMSVEEGHHGKHVNISMAVENDNQGKDNASNSDNKDGFCNLFTGKWVYDESYVLYVDGPCPFASADVNCRENGRVDSSYERWRWQPHDCDLPRFDALVMLEALRGKRLVYVGDSINRNQWQSMLCLLRVAVPYDESNMYTKDDGYFLQYFVKSFNCSIEFSWAPFLVQLNWNTGKETLSIDVISRQSQNWKDADILVFNSWHWWTHPEPHKGINYFEEGGQIIPYMEEHAAFEKAMRTWTKWISTHINPTKTQVYFRGYSPLHFHGKGWGKTVGGGCFNETEPIDKMEGEAKRGHDEGKKMEIVEKVVEESKKSVELKLLNITEMSMYRKDGHPSVYTSKYATMTDKNDYSHADCSHWCLPGLPDVWNNILYDFLV